MFISALLAFILASIFLAVDVMLHLNLFIKLPLIGFVLIGLIYKDPRTFRYFGGGAIILSISSAVLLGTNDNIWHNLFNGSSEIIAILVTSISLYFYQGEEIRFKQAYKSTTIGNIIANSAGVIKSVNPAFEKMTGYSNNELVGDNISKLMPESIGSRHPQFIKSYQKTGIKKLIGTGRELELVRKDGMKIPMHLGIGELTNSRETLFLASISDLTEINKAKDKAVNSNLAKTQFLSNMSHELRTPLNAIIGFSSLIKDQSVEKLGINKINEYNELINVSGLHLLSIINDILDISKADLGTIKLNLVPTNLNKTIQLAIDITSEKTISNNNQYQFSYDKNISIARLDSKLLLQVMINLIENASKFTSNGHITINAKLNETYSRIIIEVLDTGLGIDKKHLKQIYDRFFVVDNTFSKNVGGSGLGLSIVKEMVNVMMGDIHLESSLGEGSYFTITLPYLPVPDSSNTEHPLKEVQSKSQKPGSLYS